MHGTRLLIIPLFCILLCSACAHTPGALNNDDSILMMREDYLVSHPEGRYNKYIEKGQVVKGMNLVEVSASWGIPHSRSKSRDAKLEYWMFFDRDESSGDWTQYTMVFEQGILSDWELDRHFTKNGMLTLWHIPVNDPDTVVRSLPGSGESAGKR